MVLVLGNRTARAAACVKIHAAPDGWVMRLTEPTRSLEQNALMWPLLEQFSQQKAWPVNGVMVHMPSEEWKDVLTAGFENETLRIAQGLNGGMVLLGRKTRTYGKRKFSEFIDYIYSEAANLGVVISAPAMTPHDR